MQTSNGEVLNLESLCQPSKRKEERSTRQGNNLTDEDSSIGEDNSDINTSSDDSERINSSEGEPASLSDEQNEDGATEP